MFLDRTIERVMGLGVVVKATVMGFVIGSIDVAFLEQLVLVVVSAVVTGIFAFMVAWYTTRKTNQIHARLDVMEQRQSNVAAAVGADPESPPSPHLAPTK